MGDPSSGSGTMTQVRETGSELVAQAQEQVGVKAEEVRGELAYRLQDQVDYRSTQAGEQVQAMSHALRSGVEQLRSEGKDGSADIVEKLAQRAESLGGYLQSSNGDRILEDVETFARRRPWLTAGAAALAGFAASRFLKASSDRRYEASARQRALASGSS
jgi:hypothetical protein